MVSSVIQIYSHVVREFWGEFGKMGRLRRRIVSPFHLFRNHRRASLCTRLFSPAFPGQDPFALRIIIFILADKGEG